MNNYSVFFFSVNVVYRNIMSQIYLAHHKALSISYKSTSPKNFWNLGPSNDDASEKKRVPALYKDLFTLILPISLMNSPPNMLEQISFVEQAASHCRISHRASIQGTFWST